MFKEKNTKCIYSIELKWYIGKSMIQHNPKKTASKPIRELNFLTKTFNWFGKIQIEIWNKRYSICMQVCTFFMGIKLYWARSKPEPTMTEVRCGAVRCGTVRTTVWYGLLWLLFCNCSLICFIAVAWFIKLKSPPNEVYTDTAAYSCSTKPPIYSKRS